MESRDWEIISKLYLLKNITKAATSLYISQPAVTGRIKAIENELAVKIILRSNKGITFTPIGELVAEYANTQILSFEKFKIEIQEQEKDISGKLKIMAPQIVVKYILPTLVKEFTEMYPTVKFEIKTAQSSDVVTNIKAGHASFGFVRNDSVIDNIEKMLFETNTISVVSRNDFKMANLPQMTRVDYVTDGYYRNILNTWWDTNFKEEPKIGMELSNLEVCKEMVLSGVGYGILPTMTIDSVESLYKKTVLDSNEEPIPRNTWLVYRKESLDRKLPQAFLAFIKNRILEK